MTQTIQFHPSRASGSDVGALVQDGRVHSSAFTDAEIFKLEQERIFEGTWSI